MLKVLIKKQLMEIFRSYFFDAKNGKKRSAKGVIGYFVLFAVLMVGAIGGMFTALSILMCDGLVAVGMDWLYFLIMGGIALMFGAFGSVFNTFSSLYLAKDNDLLLAMPIPVKYLLVSRLMGVYLMGLLFSGITIIPALIVYWLTAPVTALKVLGGIAMVMVISFAAFSLSCILGYAVAKISLRLKNRKMIVTLISLLFLAAYYYLYIKAQTLVRELIANALMYGEKITGSIAGRGLRLFGLVGAGDPKAILIFVFAVAALTALVLYLLGRSFLKVVTSTETVKKAQYREKVAKMRPAFRTLLWKEFKHFASSPNYILNSGLGTVMIPAAGVLFFIKGEQMFQAFGEAFTSRPGAAIVLVSGFLMALASTNDIAAPSVSLEGKNLWLSRALPVKTESVLFAKLALHLFMTVIPVTVASVLLAAGMKLTGLSAVLAVVSPILFELVIAIGALGIGILLPNLNWSAEIYVVKQSACVAIALFGGWALAAIETAPFFLIHFSAEAYLLIICALNLLLSVLAIWWLRTKGVEKFEKL